MKAQYLSAMDLDELPNTPATKINPNIIKNCIPDFRCCTLF